MKHSPISNPIFNCEIRSVYRIFKLKNTHLYPQTHISVHLYLSLLGSLRLAFMEIQQRWWTIGGWRPLCTLGVLSCPLGFPMNISIVSSGCGKLIRTSLTGGRSGGGGDLESGWAHLFFFFFFSSWWFQVLEENGMHGFGTTLLKYKWFLMGC